MAPKVANMACQAGRERRSPRLHPHSARGVSQPAEEGAPHGGEDGLPSALTLVPRDAQDMAGVQAVMTNSFGFGGTNASLVFGRV